MLIKIQYTKLGVTGFMFELKALKSKIVFLMGYSIAMATVHNKTKATTCSPVTGNLFDTIIVASTKNERMKRSVENNTGNCYELPEVSLSK